MRRRSLLAALAVLLTMGPGEAISNEEILLQSKDVVLGPAGVAGVLTAEAKAYRALQKSAELSRVIDRLSASSNPNAQVYAAFLSLQLGKEKSRPYWSRLKGRQDSINFCAGGCMRKSITLDALAQRYP